MTDQTPAPAFNYFLRIAYDGTNFRGWQRQPGHVITIQQSIEDLLSRVHQREVTVGGCGRTDAGVHASQYYLHLRVRKALPPNYLFFVNKQLPVGIALLEVIPVSSRAQARYDATERTYDYFLHDAPDAFLDRFSGCYDLSQFVPERVTTALPLLLEYTDFRAFCKTPDRHKTTIVHFREVALFRDESGGRYRLRFVANRFLRGMIRLLVNDLLALGNGDLSLANFEDMLRSGKRLPHFRLAHPEGLFLTGVRYPYLDREPDLPVSGQVVWHRLS
ncbi:MAG: tRNA pseudouridine synthase A [Bacteroidota bacterium]